MKKKDVRVGDTYEVKVSGKLARVRLDAMNEHGKWVGTNLDTGRSIRGANAGRLRRPLGIAPTAVGSVTASAAALWRQWQRLKDSNPETILLFLVGDRFEAYGDDATVCRKVLDLALAMRGGALPETSIPIAGFPETDLEASITKLVAAGHRVAVCERVAVEARGKPVETIVG